MNNVKILDCTLRDGAYIVNAEFGKAAIKGIISKTQQAGIEIIECGWLKNSEYKAGTSFFHVPSDLEQYLEHKDKSKTYVVMIDWDRYDLNNLPLYDGNSIDAIRVVFPHGKHKEGIEVGRQIRDKGYQVFFQAANTLAYSDADLIELVTDINAFKPVAISVVDTFGAMYPDDLRHIISLVDENLLPEIAIGFHSHNNQQLSFALSMEFINFFKAGNRSIMIDASLCGMGRGAGNTTTELIVSYMNKKCGRHYNLDMVMDAIDIYMEYFKENYEWGYSTPYFIAGLYCCHVNNIAYLKNNHRTNARDMKNIIESLSAADRKKYDYDLLEHKYITNRNYRVDDSKDMEKLSQLFGDKEILLVAPGKSSLSEKKKIVEYIEQNKPIVVGVNAILPDYKYDYMFFANPARYEYAHNAHEKVFVETKKILLSNVKNESDVGEFIVGFNNVVKRGWTHFDNAVICCLRLIEKLGVAKVALAGFDGFKNKYNESYADKYLPPLNPNNKWDELNAEITDIFADFKANSKIGKDIVFLTESIFNK